jgi:hypothetical protein
MTDTLPDWADPEASRALFDLRSKGEGPRAEFKGEFPSDVSKIAKTIAAFASTDGGSIFIGVDNEGSLVGLPLAETQAGRDELMKRIEGICSGPVKPAVMAHVRFAVEEGKAVMVIDVPRGTEPVYYSHEKPYVRHLTTSRPAHPHEVVVLIKRYLQLGVVAAAPIDLNAPPELPDWMTQLYQAVLPVLIFGREATSREADPWLSLWINEFRTSAERLRRLMISKALPPAHAEKVKPLIAKLDEISNFRMYIGAGSTFRPLVREALDQASDLWEHDVKSTIAGDKRAALRQAIEQADGWLVDLHERGRTMLFSGDSDEFQRQVSRVGRDVLETAYLVLNVEDERSKKLLDAAHALHLVEARRLYLDGGQSQEKLLADIARLRDQLITAASELTSSSYATPA